MARYNRTRSVFTNIWNAVLKPSDKEQYRWFKESVKRYTDGRMYKGAPQFLDIYLHKGVGVVGLLLTDDGYKVIIFKEEWRPHADLIMKEFTRGLSIKHTILNSKKFSKKKRMDAIEFIVSIYSKYLKEINGSDKEDE